jgi:multidrug resistance efflux pump
VYAPTRGYATQVVLRPGMRAVNIPLRPVMVFVSAEDHYLVGWFRQNSLLRLEIGSEAEVAFDGVPGTVFTGEVTMVQPALAEGQVDPTGTLISPIRALHPGRVAVLIEITDPRYSEYVDRIPGGAYAQTAVYSEHFHHVAIMRRILLRMSSWMNYLFPFH